MAMAKPFVSDKHRRCDVGQDRPGAGEPHPSRSVNAKLYKCSRIISGSGVPDRPVSIVMVALAAALGHCWLRLADSEQSKRLSPRWLS